jgi:hypothetical protein
MLCFSGLGALLLSLTQPISYLFGIYLLKNKKGKAIKAALFINLLITWGILVMTINWNLTH